VKDSFSNVKVWLNWLKHEGVVHENPMAGERPPKVPKRIIQPFSQANLKELLELCASGTDYCSARNTAIVLVFIDSGVRLAEMVSMKISSINMEAGTIKVFGKGAKERLVGIGQQSRRAILRYLLFRKTSEDSNQTPAVNPSKLRHFSLDRYGSGIYNCVRTKVLKEVN